jgi:glycosyltransferase involved in cell wall biosynthesis
MGGGACIVKKRLKVIVTLAPIVLFAYNRPWHTKQTIDALLRNDLAAESELFIFSDGSKDESSANSVAKVRRYLKTISGFKSVKIVEQKQNLGLASSIIRGVTSVCNEHGKVIVLEDDIVTSSHFLSYMNEALDKYADDDRVICIHGYVYPVKEKLSEAFFLRGADCWGWATWKRGWDLFNPDGEALLKELNSNELIKEFDFNGAYSFSKMLKDQIKGKNDSWAVRWYASAFLANKLTLYPGKSLVHNIGNDNSGSHCRHSSFMDADLTVTPIDCHDVEVEHSIDGYNAFERFFRKANPSFLIKVLRRLKMQLGRL